jgi:hypothetical protein
MFTKKEIEEFSKITIDDPEELLIDVLKEINSLKPNGNVDGVFFKIELDQLKRLKNDLELVLEKIREN